MQAGSSNSSVCSVTYAYGSNSHSQPGTGAIVELAVAAADVCDSDSSNRCMITLVEMYAKLCRSVLRCAVPAWQVYDLLNALEDRLGVNNSAVVLATIKVRRRLVF
jgi:hypothetical protein